MKFIRRSMFSFSFFENNYFYDPFSYETSITTHTNHRFRRQDDFARIVYDETSNESFVSFILDKCLSMSNDQNINPIRRKPRPRGGPTTIVVDYGPISIRRRQTFTPTLATGRRPKDAVLVNEDADKRDMRRMKNRESARRLKKERDQIADELQKQVEKLQSEQENLLTEINFLRDYKQQLQQQYRESSPIYHIITQTAADILTKLKQQQLSEEIKSEDKPSRSPSPPWQLAFHI